MEKHSGSFSAQVDVSLDSNDGDYVTVSTWLKPSVETLDSRHCVMFKSGDRCVKQNQQTINDKITTEEEMACRKKKSLVILTCGKTCLNRNEESFKEDKDVNTTERTVLEALVIHFNEISRKTIRAGIMQHLKTVSYSRHVG